MKRILLLIITIISLIYPKSIHAENTSYGYYDLEYTIDKYDINIIVNENNTMDVTETITANFIEPKHGIYRLIPLRNTVTRLDGTTNKNRVQITNLSVNNKYSTSKEDGNLKIKIGSANETLTGKQTYIIKYNYNIGKDPIKDKDEFYYNIIGDKWDTTISNITFSIHMPKEFDTSKIGFSKGKRGSISNSNISYQTEGLNITGQYNDTLRINEALTIRCELPEGYFVGAGFYINIVEYIAYFIPILFLGIAAVLWYKFGRDDQVIETVEFYPPENLNSLEIGYIYKGYVDGKDIISLLIYLANKGYIKIIEINKKKTDELDDDEFKIIKLKDYDGENINEQVFLKELFKKDSHSISSTMDEVTSEDIDDRFYEVENKILSNINSKENKIFEEKPSSKIKYIIAMIIITYCGITIYPIINYGNFNIISTLIITLLISMISIALVFIILSDKALNSISAGFGGSKALTLIMLIICGSVLIIPLWVIFYLPMLLQETIYLIGYIIGIVCILGMLIFIKYLPKRTHFGNKILGKIKGFKNFLETVEKDKLEKLVNKNPEYFYDILPYTYVLNISDKWIEKFESILLQQPSWYDSNKEFNINTFHTFIDNVTFSLEYDLSGSSISSSGSSGGGFSGGGSGGGGGGSW